MALGRLASVVLRSAFAFASAVLVIACSRRGAVEREETQPPAGALEAASPVAPRRYGDLMGEVGRRFERVGRSVEAEQWDLARYDLVQLEAIFENDVARAHAPEDIGVPLREHAREYGRSLPVEMRTAVEAHDRVAFARAFAHAADACNACHRGVGRAFLEIPASPGQPVPIVRSAAPGE